MHYSFNKYKNQKTIVNGICFDSKKEALRYTELKFLEKSQIIKNLELQVKYVLIPKQEGERECSYYADFVYDDCKSDMSIVEDVKSSKSFQTDVYKIKRKLMLYIHGIRIKETY